MPHPAPVSARRLILSALGLSLIGAGATALAGPLDWIKGGEGVAGNGSIKQQRRTPGHFTGVALLLPGSVELRLAATDDILIETDDNLLPLIETVVENGVLQIRPTKRNTNLRTRTMKFVIQARELNRLTVGGAGLIAADLIKGPQLQCNIEGSGTIELRRVETGALTVNIAGSGDFSAAAGTTGTLAVSIGGSGDVELTHLTAQDAKVSIAGSGDVRLAVRGKLDASIAGSGDITYFGDPKVSRSVAGSGEITRGGPIR